MGKLTATALLLVFVGTLALTSAARRRPSRPRTSSTSTASLAARVAKLEAAQKLQAAGGSTAFQVRKITDKDPFKDDIIVFEEVVLNRNDGYDKNTGIFTCPEGGTYVLTAMLQGQGYVNQSFHVQLKVNHDTVAEIYEDILDDDDDDDDDADYTRTIAIVQQLHTGDEVYLVAGDDDTLFDDLDDYGFRIFSNIFSGVNVIPDGS